MFINETIDTTTLPRYQDVPLSPLHPAYAKVIVLRWLLFCVFAVTAFVLAVLFIEEFSGALLVGVALSPVLILVLVFSFWAYRKKAFAFRNHDVLYRHGLIATTTIVIPYNRIQHVALHEGWLSRMFGLATVEVFTAGGSSGDIAIPGIAKAQAQDIKQLLMGKIQKVL